MCEYVSDVCMRVCVSDECVSVCVSDDCENVLVMGMLVMSVRMC